MATRVTDDRRLQDRALRKGQMNAEDVQSRVLSLPDSAEAAEPRSAEEIEKLRETLAAEKRVRDERIEVARTRRPAIARPVHATAPLDDEL